MLQSMSRKNQQQVRGELISGKGLVSPPQLTPSDQTSHLMHGSIFLALYVLTKLPGNTVSVNYTVNDTYTGAGMISGRTYVFAAWDSATAETEYDSPPIYLDSAPTLRKRGRWVETWF